MKLKHLHRKQAKEENGEGHAGELREAVSPRIVPDVYQPSHIRGLWALV